MKKRILASLLTIVMLLGILPTAALAAPTTDKGVVITVREEGTNNPIEGATVILKYNSDWVNKEYPGYTDSNGQALFDSVSVGLSNSRDYSVRVTKDGYETGSGTVTVSYGGWSNPKTTGEVTIHLKPVKDLTVVRFFVTGLNNPMYVLQNVKDANGALIGTEGTPLQGTLTVGPNYIIYGDAPYYGEIVDKSDIGGDIENWAKSNLPDFQNVIAAIQKTIADKSNDEGWSGVTFDPDEYDGLEIVSCSDEDGWERAYHVDVRLKPKTFTIAYEATAGGSVDPASESVKKTDTPQGSTATPNEGYEFVGWYDTDDKKVSDETHFAPTSVSDNVTYYAKFREKSEGTQGAPVYVYAQIVDGKGNTLTPDKLKEFNAQLEKPLTMNADVGGWLTLGKIENFENLEDAASAKNTTYNLSTNTEMAAAAKKEVHYMVPYESVDNVVNPIDTSKVTWKELKVVDRGAANYDDVTGYAWHLDGQIKVTALVDLKVEKTVARIVRGDNVVYSADDGTAPVPNAEPGDVITWNITVSNSGCLSARIKAPTDTLTMDPNAQDGTKSLTVMYGDEPVGEGLYTVPANDGSINFTAEYTVTDEDQGKTLTNVAKIGEDGPSGSNNEVKVAEKQPYDVTIYYYNEDTEETLKDSVTVSYAAGESYNYTNDPEKIPASLTADGKNYAKTRVDGALSGSSAATIKVYYSLDEKVDPTVLNRPESGDGIPDKYQAKVTFRVINGTWANGTTPLQEHVVTLYEQGENGSWVKKQPAPTVTVPSGMIAAFGYTGGSWAPAATSGAPLTVSEPGEHNYTYTFIPKSVTPGYNPPSYNRDDDDDDDRDSGKLNTNEHHSYIIGYKDGTIRPYGTITRGEVATIFFRLLTDETRDRYWSQTNPYSDCNEALWCNNAISTLTSMGILDGFQDGTFRPYAKITRAQFAKIAVGFFETDREAYSGYFTDVPADAWFTEYIEAASRAGLIQGFADGTYRPDTDITRAQACVIVNRALGRKPDEEHLLKPAKMITWPDNNPDDWFYADIQEATNSHDYRWLSQGKDRQYMEQWTERLEQRNWAALEHAWSTAHSAPGGEVLK